jgi:hypothetical protein
MRAVQITRFGGPEVLDVVDIPEPEAGSGAEGLRRLDGGDQLRRHPPRRVVRGTSAMGVGMRKALLVVPTSRPTHGDPVAVWSISEGAGTMAASPKATNVAAPRP